MPCVYETEQELLSLCPTLEAKVAKIDLIISALEDVMINSAANRETGSYSLDDGQTKINRTFRSSKEIADSIEAFMRIRNIYVRRITGGRVQLINLDRINYP